MVLPAITDRIYEEFLQARANNHQSPVTHEEFLTTLQTWYREFQDANCSLGYAAAQMGITQVDFIYILDMLGWKVTNL
jgi:hypothetical protein